MGAFTQGFNIMEHATINIFPQSQRSLNYGNNCTVRNNFEPSRKISDMLPCPNEEKKMSTIIKIKLQLGLCLPEHYFHVILELSDYTP